MDQRSLEGTTKRARKYAHHDIERSDTLPCHTNASNTAYYDEGRARANTGIRGGAGQRDEL